MYRTRLISANAVFFIVFFLLLLCSSCSSQRTTPAKTLRYTLEYAPPVFSGLPTLDTTLRIASFGSAPEFDSERIQYKTGKFTLDSYNYHAWMAKPAAQVQFFLGRDLQRSGLFTAVLADTGRYRPAYLLGGSVDKFLEVDEGQQWFAELSLDIILQRMPQKNALTRILDQHHYEAKKACSHRNPQAVAEAMSMAMAELSKQIQNDIYTIIKNDLAERTGG